MFNTQTETNRRCYSKTCWKYGAGDVGNAVCLVLLLLYCQVYDDNTGIKLTPDAAGLCIVRAIAVSPGMIPSELFLSKSAPLLSHC